MTCKYPGASTEAQSHNKEESLLLTTGGLADSSLLTSVEIFPGTNISGCSPPPLPAGRDGHTTFLTSEPNPVIATCGGVGGGASCLVLDKINQRWDESRMGNLTMPREASAVATLNFVGVFIIGGYGANNMRTSDFLAAGQMQWQEGPALPVDMGTPCTVTITPSSYLAIYGTNIREFDAVIAGPSNIKSWREEGRWPKLKTSRTDWPGCAKIGRKVIIAGGRNSGGILRSTEVLDLDTHKITAGGDMASPRDWFSLATLRREGEEQVFAVAGEDRPNDELNTVEEWVEANSTWKAADNLARAKTYFSAVAVPVDLICPT